MPRMLAPDFVCTQAEWTHQAWPCKMRGRETTMSGFPTKGGNTFTLAPVDDRPATSLLHRRTDDAQPRLKPFVLMGRTEGDLAAWLAASNIAPPPTQWDVSLLASSGTMAMTMTRYRINLKLRVVKAASARRAGVEWKGVWVVSAQMLCPRCAQSVCVCVCVCVCCPCCC